MTGIEPVEGVDDRVGSREDLQRHLAAADDRRAAVSHAGDRADLSPEQTKRMDRGLVCADSRSTAALSRHDAVLEEKTVENVYPPGKREPYSASRIERYVECGFKFYAENVLEIEDPDDVEVSPTPLETGSYVHDVLERSTQASSPARTTESTSGPSTGANSTPTCSILHSTNSTGGISTTMDCSPTGG